MSSKVVKHGKHEHSIKTVNEEVMGILIDDRGTDRISESFGWSEKKFESLFDKFESFIVFQEATDRLYDAGEPDMLPRGTKTSQLVDFLKSNVFKGLGIKLETPNDYLMLGFIYCATLTKLGLEDIVNQMAGNKQDPKRVIELLKEFRKAIEDR